MILCVFLWAQSFEDVAAIGTFNGLKISSGYSSISNVTNAGMASDILLRSAFRESSKSAFLSNSNEHAFYLSDFNTTLDYYLTDSNQSLKVSFGIERTLFASLNKDFSSMLLFGNAQFAGSEVTSSGILATDYNRYRFSVSSVRHFKNAALLWRAGLNSLTSLHQITAEHLSLYTEANGETVELDARNLNYVLSQGGALGFEAGFNWRGTTSKGLIYDLSLDDFGIAWTSNTSKYKIDTAADFSGFNIAISDLGNGKLEEKIDSSIMSFIDTFSGHHTIILPIRISGQIIKTIGGNGELLLKAGMIRMGGTAAQIAIGYKYLFTQKERYHFAVNSEIGYGNYSGIFWNEKIEMFKGKLGLQLNLVGLNSLIIPLNSTTYGASFGLLRSF